eukprot:TRINITY_DN15666_c0_g4_i1.p1 TRINITY_DN15666_c0_g4~~TRINITY_DN15666_c0_g4_i1.p1  ORF type:complete len:361 (-),score=101.11 TRINITY_DN15666_c0_g4_i1:191-1273(-)
MASISFEENSPLGDVLKVSHGASASDWIGKWKEYCLEVKDAALIRPVTLAVAGILSSFKAEATEDGMKFVSILEEIPLPPTVLFECLYNFYLFIDKSKAQELGLNVLHRALKAAHSKHLPIGDALRNLVLQDMEHVPVEESSNILAHLVLCSLDDYSLIHTFLAVNRSEWGNGLKDEEREALFRLIFDAVKKSDTDLLRRLWKSSYMTPLKEKEGNTFKLLEVFVLGDMESFESFSKGLPPTFFDGVKVPLKEDCVLSMSLLDLLKLLEDLPLTMTYEEVAKGIRIEVGDVEETLVEAVSRGLVALKMDQVNAKITFLSKSLRQFDEKEWRLLKDRVESYRKRIARVKDVLESVRQGGRA